MGVLEAGFNASLLDRETQDAFRFFHKLAPDLFGASFPTAVVTGRRTESRSDLSNAIDEFTAVNREHWMRTLVNPL